MRFDAADGARRHRLGMVLAFTGLALVLVALAVPGRASAQLVFDVGNDIWASSDDGSGAHVLVTAASLGMDQGLGDPAVAPNGSTLLFDGLTHAHATVDALSGAAFYGLNAAGAYELSGGTVKRLSGAPQATPASLETDDIVPEPGPGGTYVYNYEKCVPQTTYYDLPNKACGGWVRSAPVAAGAAGASPFATSCDGDDGIPSTPPSDPSADPASGPLRVAYVGCETPSQIANGGPASQNQLIVSGSGGQGQVTVALGPEASNAAIGDPDLADPSWSPDGSQIVLYDAGGTDYTSGASVPGGLYVFSNLSATNAGRLVLQDPLQADGSADRIRSPRFMGPGTIVFVLDGSVYSIPASCNACTIANATLLHAGGADASTQSFSVTWTSGTVAPAHTGGSGSGGGTGGGGGGGGQTGGGGHSGGGHTGGGRHIRVHLSVARIARQRLGKLLGHGLAVKARCSRACRLSVTLTVTPAVARRYGLISARTYRRLRHRHGARVAVGHAGRRLAAGKRHTVRLGLTGKARRRLRHARRLTLTLHASARAASARATVTRKVTARR